jgi:hypothetical protein
MDIKNFHVGQRVRVLEAVGDAPSGDAPGGVYATRGEILVVRKINPSTFAYPIQVSHEDITDSSFGVKLTEIEPVTEQEQP